MHKIPFNIGDKVQVIRTNDERGSRSVLKVGHIVELTDAGARVWNPKTEKPFTDLFIGAEWFPFDSKNVRILLLAKSKRCNKPSEKFGKKVKRS